MSEVFDDIIDRETDVARIAAVVASDFRFAIFRHRRVRGAAVAARSEIDGRRADESRRASNVLNTKPELLREFCGPSREARRRDRDALRRWHGGRNSEFLRPPR
jgi:hypothetical protein